MNDSELEFRQRAAVEYRDFIAERMQHAIQSGHMEPSVCVSVLMQVAAMIASGGLGAEGASYIERVAHSLAESMRVDAPTLN